MKKHFEEITSTGFNVLPLIDKVWEQTFTKNKGKPMAFYRKNYRLPVRERTKQSGKYSIKEVKSVPLPCWHKFRCKQK